MKIRKAAERVIAAASKAFGIPEHEIRDRKWGQNDTAVARMACFHFLREMDIPYKRIASWFWRTERSVKFGCAKVKARLESGDEIFTEAFRDMERELFPERHRPGTSVKCPTCEGKGFVEVKARR